MMKEDFFLIPGEIIQNMTPENIDIFKNRLVHYAFTIKISYIYGDYGYRLIETYKVDIENESNIPDKIKKYIHNNIKFDFSTDTPKIILSGALNKIKSISEIPFIHIHGCVWIYTNK